MMNQPQQGVPAPIAGAPEVLYHVCFGGHPECSGANPCPECQAILHQVATRQALGAAFQSMGMAPQEIPSAVEFAMAHFEAGYEAGKARLHEGMRSDPYLRSQLHVSALSPSSSPSPSAAGAPVGAPLRVNGQAAVAAPPYQPALPTAPQAATTPVQLAAPIASQPQALGSIFEAAAQDRAPPNGGVPPEVPRVAAPEGAASAAGGERIRPMARPMTIEEIATAGHVLPDMDADQPLPSDHS